MVFACGPPDVLHNLFGSRGPSLGIRSHFCPKHGYDEPEILLCSSQPICPMRSAVGQAAEPGPPDAEISAGLNSTSNLFCMLENAQFALNIASFLVH